MSKIIIGLCGHIASGKGAAADYLVAKHQGQMFGFSTPLRQILKLLYLPAERHNLQDLSTILRQRFGNDLLAKVLYETVKDYDGQLAVVDGIRRLDDIKYLKELDNFILVSVEADPKIRYKRLSQRQQNSDDSQKTWEEFLADEQKETELSIDGVAKQANLVINNNSSFEDFHTQLGQLIS